MKLKKRLLPPILPGHDGLNRRYYLHKNVSHVYQQPVQDPIRKATAIQKAWKESDESKKPDASTKTEERWVHPGFEGTCIGGTVKGMSIVYNNVTCADKVAILKRIEKAAVFEQSTKELGVSGNEERPGKDEKFWFDRSFDLVKLVPTPKGALFVPANTTDTRRRLIHRAVLTVMGAYGDWIERKAWYDNGDRYGGLIERELDCSLPTGEVMTHENC
ncbi:hypothetical protein CDV36_010918 [Fusarium kuroshium]|uniref:Uncharacterized protein n=1 Tax=Fusarium kuroshium TaxID=2010991 RepID=A0A3M2RVY5_9HYPO|nr:hypothetical protein CDV36_010918 [Fusarium kuroshium]